MLACFSWPVARCVAVAPSLFFSFFFLSLLSIFRKRFRSWVQFPIPSVSHMPVYKDSNFALPGV
jgi:hypothetical protein